MYGIPNLIVVTVHTFSSVYYSTRQIILIQNLAGFAYQFRFNVDDKDIVAMARSSEVPSEIWNVVLIWLAACVMHSVRLENSISPSTLKPINVPTLAYLMALIGGIALIEHRCRLFEARPRHRNYIIAQVMQPQYWLRSLDATRDQPSLIYVILTIHFSRMVCAESVV